MREIYGFCYIKSALSLGELASLISENVCGGIAFKHIETYTNADISEMRTQEPFFGLSATLFGDPEIYGLEIAFKEADIDSDDSAIDLSEYFCRLLNNIKGITAMTEKNAGSFIR